LTNSANHYATPPTKEREGVGRIGKGGGGLDLDICPAAPSSYSYATECFYVTNAAYRLDPFRRLVYTDFTDTQTDSRRVG